MADTFDEKINKHQDWGGDESTGGRIVAGGRVQEFIKEQLNSKAGIFYYDTANNRYIVFADAETREEYLADTTKTALILGAFDAPFNYMAEITLLTPAYVAILTGATGNYIDFSFDVKNKSGASTGEAVNATFTFIHQGNKQVVNRKYQAGTMVHFNIDEYLQKGANSITVGIVGETTLAATTVGITYQVVDLRLSDTYDISQAYDLRSNPALSLSVPYHVEGYGTKEMEWYLDGALLEYVRVEDEVVEVAADRSKYISLSNLSHGVHRLQYRAKINISGEFFYSNSLYRDFVVLATNDRTPIIAVAAEIPVQYGILSAGENLQLYGVMQYVPYTLRFAVYNPSGAATTDAVIAVDGTVAATVSTKNGEENIYSLKINQVGVHGVTITSGNTVYVIGLNVSPTSMQLNEITNGLTLSLSALGKSNNDADKDSWRYGLYSTTFSGFSWNAQSGWVNNRLRISRGAQAIVNMTPLSPDPSTNGKTLEFEFSTENVSDENAVICDMRGANGAGLLITASEASLISAGGTKVSTKYKAGENNRIVFVINRRSGVANQRLVFMYVNGVLSGGQPYANTDNFTSAKELRIGGVSTVDILLKELRFYNMALSPDQVLNNYILYRETSEEMTAIYDKNDIYETGSQAFSMNKLTAQLPVMIITGDIPALENTSDKNLTIYVDIEFINLQDPSKSFTAKGVRMRPQGTSSMGYPKKNFRIYTGYGEMKDSGGNIILEGLYQFVDGAQPVNCWCLKTDYAESSSTHNTSIARLWNQVMTDTQVNGDYALRTEAQKAAIGNAYPYDVRTTVDGFPILMFYRPTADAPLIFIGKYNFNNDKSTESVFGFRDIPGFDNSRMQCWEVLNNGHHLCNFQDMINFDAEWTEAYESRFPDDGEDADTTDLKAFSEWVVSTKGNPARFAAEKWAHLDVYKMAAYYIYLMRFGAVDQVVKNSMMTSEDGEHFYFINYDNDTINGLRNDGLLIYDYNINRQTLDTSYAETVYAYAGHDSTLWNNLEADEEFMSIVAEVDNALYIGGLTYQNVIDMFYNKQSDKWCHRVYNQDAQYKYIDTYINQGINNMYMLQGRRDAHRRWWLSHRFDLIDSMFVSGAYKARSIEMKVANAPIGISFSVTAGNNLYYGYGVNNVPVDTKIQLAQGQSHTFTTRQVLNVGDPLRIYSGVNIEGLDLSSFIAYMSTLNIAEVWNEENGTKLKRLVLGVNHLSDARRNTSLYEISGLSRASRLEYLDITGYMGLTSLDLGALPNLETLKAKQSGLTSAVFANGAPVSLLELPDTMQSVYFDSLLQLSNAGLSIENQGQNIHTIFIRNCKLFDTKTFVESWLNYKVTEDGFCSVTIEGIDWFNVDPEWLVRLGGIKKFGGTLVLKGRIRLTSINEEQATLIKEYFGASSTIPGSELWITAPSAVFLIGETSILAGSTVEYTASIFSDTTGRIEYYLAYNDIEGQSFTYNGVHSIDKDTGVLTTTYFGFPPGAMSSAKFIVRAKFYPGDGEAVSVANLPCTLEPNIYPDRGTITLRGGGQINRIGNYTFDIATAYGVNNLPVSPNYRTEWALSGDAFNQGLISLGTNNRDQCVVSVSGLPGDPVFFTLTANFFRTSDGQKTGSAPTEFDIRTPGIIMTRASNPEVMDIVYAQGWAANRSYMTEQEASAVTSLGKVFQNSQIKHFKEFEYFTNVTNLLYDSFIRCYSLTAIRLPDSVTNISSQCFYDCYSLLSIRLSAGLTNIGDYCFQYCRSLASIDLPAGLTSLGNHCFNNCESLTEITLPAGLRNLGTRCFQACTSLTTANLSSAVFWELPDYCFNNCRSLVSIHLPAGLTHIGNYCFSGCTLLPSIDFPAGLTYLGNYCFNACTSLTEIILPDEFFGFGYNCFQRCTSLIYIYIGHNIFNLSAALFDGCTNLRTIILKRSSAPYAAATFGNGPDQYAGYNTRDQGVNILYVPVGATGYDTDVWVDPVQDPTKCGFTISYTL